MLLRPRSVAFNLIPTKGRTTMFKSPSPHPLVVRYSIMVKSLKEIYGSHLKFQIFGLNLGTPFSCTVSK